jgi:hypothetical protein
MTYVVPPGIRNHEDRPGQCPDDRRSRYEYGGTVVAQVEPGDHFADGFDLTTAENLLVAVVAQATATIPTAAWVKDRTTSNALG